MDVTIQQLSQQELQDKGVFSWGIWEKEVSQFDWYYDSVEHCYILEGEVSVSTDSGEYSIKAGDFVTFRKDLSCKWNVTKDIRKHYLFE